MSHDEPALDMGALDEAQPVTSDDEDTVQSSVEQDTSEMPTEGGMDVDVVSPDRDRDDDTEPDAQHEVAPEHLNNSQCRWCRDEFGGVSTRRTHDCPDARDQIECPTSQTHESLVQAMWTPGDGLHAYARLVSSVQDLADEGGHATVTVAGETWVVDSLTWREGGLQVPPALADREWDALPEPRLTLVGEPQVQPPEGHQWDDPRRRRVSVDLKPALPDARTAADGEAAGGIPDECPEGYRCQFNSAYVDPDEAFTVWQAFLGEALDLPEVARQSGRDDLHEWSRGGAIAQYLRLDRDLAHDKLTSTGGLLPQLAEVASHQGGVGGYDWDDSKIEGYQHDVFLDQHTLSKLFGGAVRVGAQIHVYQPELPRGDDVDPDADPLKDTKIEVRWSPAKDDGGRDNGIGYDRDLGNEPVPVDADRRLDLAGVRADLEQLLLCLCDWAGISLSDDEVWTPDSYFEPDIQLRERQLVGNPIPDLREAEQTAVEQTLHAGDLSPAERAVVAHVVDEGQSHWEDLVADAEVSRSTVYRVAERLDDLLRVVDGVVQTTDQVVRDRLAEAIHAFGDATAWLDGAVEDVESRVDGLGEDSPLAQWARRHCVDVTVDAGLRADDDHMEVDLGQQTENEIVRLLRAGLDAADRAGYYEAFLEATFKWSTPNGGREERPHAAGVWQVGDEPAPYRLTWGPSATG